jgi:4-hydroxysphinganine ceramide fatty acyl 2-hydroxylase
MYVVILWTWILYNFSVTEIGINLGFFLFGIFKWTVLEYYFHRFPLHQTINSIADMRSHLLHHAFPNLKRKVALGVLDCSVKISLMVAFYALFLNPLSIALIIVGLFMTMILYDFMHYLCHFGAETDIKWIKYMRIYHLKHHYRDQNRFFGVTNPFWDKVFGTGLN